VKTLWRPRLRRCRGGINKDPHGLLATARVHKSGASVENSPKEGFRSVMPSPGAISASGGRVPRAMEGRAETRQPGWQERCGCPARG